MSRFLRWSRTEHGERAQTVVMILLAPVFLGLLPALVGGVGRRIDRRLGLPSPPGGAASQVLGAALTTAGFSLGLWSVATQLGPGRGTPLPMLPTQVLLADGPFRHCRNPMTLGTILAYLGVALMARTTAGTTITLSLAGVLLGYLKRLEEPELVERFGEAYLAYRRSTPFIVPRLPHRRPGARRRGT